MVTATMKLKDTPWKKSYDQPRQHIKKQRHHFANKGQSSQSYGFSSSQVWMWESDHKEGWVLKNLWFWTVVLDKTLENPLDCKEIKPVNPKGNQSWIFTGRTDAEAESPILWLPDGKSQLIGKDPDAGTGWRWKEKGMTEDEMIGWHHWLNGLEFEQVSVDGEEEGGLAHCSLWSCKKSGTTEWLNANWMRSTYLSVVNIWNLFSNIIMQLERSTISVIKSISLLKFVEYIKERTAKLCIPLSLRLYLKWTTLLINRKSNSNLRWIIIIS